VWQWLPIFTLLSLVTFFSNFTNYSSLLTVFNIFLADVLSEEAILRWYKEGHSGKGKMMFLDQMKKFVEWLQNAEEESESGEDED
jgi:eIF4-gamma/eIF5/eIF2-epsilon